MISVIVPVYNVEKYVVQCIESVLWQTYSNLEIIIVDDGSTDSSGKVCEVYKKKDARIKVIHKVNGGLSDARNVGLTQATGTYVVFLDSDDYWNDMDFLNKVSEKIIESEPDMIIFGFRKVDDNGELGKHVPMNDTCIVEELVRNDDFNICAWDKVIKRDVLIKNGITFKKGVYSEDMEWCANLLKAADSCAVIKSDPHSYRQRIGSITKTISSRNVDDIVSNYNACLRLMDAIGPEKKDAYYCYLSKNLSMLIISLSQIERGERKEYNAFIKNNANVLKHHTRKREILIYYSLLLLGVENTEALLGRLYNRKQRGRLLEEG